MNDLSFSLSNIFLGYANIWQYFSLSHENTFPKYYGIPTSYICQQDSFPLKLRSITEITKGDGGDLSFSTSPSCSVLPGWCFLGALLLAWYLLSKGREWTPSSWPVRCIMGWELSMNRKTDIDETLSPLVLRTWSITSLEKNFNIKVPHLGFIHKFIKSRKPLFCNIYSFLNIAAWIYQLFLRKTLMSDYLLHRKATQKIDSVQPYVVSWN